MDPKSVAAGRAVTWFSCGWNIFMKSPGMWVLIAVIIGVLAAVLKSVSLGRYVLLLFAPAIGAGLLYGAAEIRAGQPLGLAQLAQGFRDQTKLMQLIVLCVVALAVAVVSRFMPGV